MIYELLVAPFVEQDVMRRALLGTIALSLSGAPIGTFLMLRRMSLAGDAISHAILPGTAAGYLLSGLSVMPMMLGGLVAGLVVALSAGLVSRLTVHKEDTSFAAFYLISLALGVLLINVKGESEDLMHILFGGIRTINTTSLLVIGLASSLSLLGLAVIWRPLVAESLDPLFLRSVSRVGPYSHGLFLVFFVLNLVAAFQALGTLLAVGLVVLPAAAARLWMNSVETISLTAAAIGSFSSFVGLVAASCFDTEAGPAIILAAGTAFLISLVAAPRGVGFRTSRAHKHRTG